MNKKLFLGMFAAAGMLFATSCSNDELDQVQSSSDQAQVTFSLGLEGGMATRAISDGTGAKKLVYAVYKLDAQNNPVLQPVVGSDANSQFVDGEAFDNGLTETVSVTLAKGQTYKIAFWAQNPDCDAYDTDDLTAVKVDYTDGTQTTPAIGDFNNDETRDAFYAAETFKVEGNKELNVTLKRPFAQINVGVYKSDWEAAVASGITIAKSSVVIKNAATSINLLTGAVGAETTDVEVSYAANTIPTEDLKVDLNKDGDFYDDNEMYKWLSMSYILVADHDNALDNNGLLGTDKSTLQGLKYTFAPVSGNVIEFEDGLAGAPVRRNWRTNILGKILTGDIQFNITIDPAYEDDFIYPEASEIEQELEFAATFGGTVTLTGPVTLSKTLNVNADMIINLNGQTITGPSEARDADNNRVHAIVNNANLTINGGTITSPADNGGSAIYNNADATLIVNNVEINGAPIVDGGWPSYGINNYGTMTINGAKVNTYHGGIATGGNGITVIEDATVDVGLNTQTKQTSWALYVFDNGQMTVNGGTFKNTKNENGQVYGGGYICAISTSKTIINGGTFDKTEGDNNGTGLYYQCKNLEIKGGVFDTNPSAYVADGYTAVDNGDNTWTVAKKITSANIVETLNNLSTTEPTTLALSEDIATNESVTIPEGADVTINLNGKNIASSTSDAFVVNKGATLTISGNGKVEANGAPIRAIGGKVIVEGGEFTQTGTWNSAVPTYRYSVDSREGGEIIIKGGTFKSNNGMINVNANSSLVIDGGNFEFENNNGGTRHFAFVSGKLTINNGEFKGVANSSAGGCFFCGAAAGCEIQINDGKFTSLWTSGSANKIFEVYYGGSINVTGGLFNTNGGIASFVEANTDDATKDAYPYKAK